MPDVLEADLDVGIEGIRGLRSDTGEDRLERIVAGASGAKAVAVRLEAGLPLRFKRQFTQRLVCPVEHHGNAQGPDLVGFACLGDQHPPHRARSDRPRVPQFLHEQEANERADGFDAIDARRLLIRGCLA